MPADRQVQEVLKKLVGVLPMKKSEITGMLKVPHAHVGAAQVKFYPILSPLIIPFFEGILDAIVYLFCERI
jgi:hypothetical protein